MKTQKSKKNRLMILLCIIVFIMVAFSVKAQQDIMHTQYMSNLLLTNPAYAGTGRILNTTLMTRNQWVGFEGAPISQIFIVNSPVLKYNLGIGGSILRDEIGPIVQNIIYFDIAYNIKVTEKARLSMGLKGSLNIIQSNLDNLGLTETNDPMFNDQDKLSVLPNFGFGLYLYSDRYYFGVASPKLLENNYDFIDIADENAGTERQHYYAMGGYLFDLNEVFKLKPSFMVKVVDSAPMSIDLTSMLIIKENLWLGVSHRIQESFSFIIQYQFTQQLRFGYAFDYTISKISSVTYGSHELMLSYDFYFSRNHNKIKSPRFF